MPVTVVLAVEGLAATYGGPVQIPKLYRGKNRTFFFYAWEENRYSTPQSFTDTVPTAAERTGGRPRRWGPDGARVG